MARAAPWEWCVDVAEVRPAEAPRRTPPGLKLAALVVGVAVVSEGGIEEVEVVVRAAAIDAAKVLVEAMDLVAVARLEEVGACRTQLTPGQGAELPDQTLERAHPVPAPGRRAPR